MSSPHERWLRFCWLRDKALERNVRTKESLRVVAVSKHHSVAAIAEHFDAVPDFPRDLGENYLQELGQKALSLELKKQNIVWHFIGSLQSRKLIEVCKIASVLHSVGREKELRILADLFKTQEQIPDFYLQFNISGEGTKLGFECDEVARVADLVQELGLARHLLGLMGSAAPLQDVGEVRVRASFALLRGLRDQHFRGAQLNMGMSSDFEFAIAEGSDMIRVGTLLFGERD